MHQTGAGQNWKTILSFILKTLVLFAATTQKSLQSEGLLILDEMSRAVGAERQTGSSGQGVGVEAEKGLGKRCEYET